MEAMFKFYKILMAVTDELQFPRGFTEKYGHMIPENAKLEIASGATWEVRVKKQEDGYFFTTGWADFCGDMKLELFDMLLFSYDGDSTFHVTAFADTAFEKASNFQAVNTKKLNPSFQVLFKKNHARQLFVNNGFVEACGLLNKQKVRLEYPGGQSREVVVNPSKKRLHVYISKGWMGFCKVNGITVGKTYSFQYIESEKVIVLRARK